MVATLDQLPRIDPAAYARDPFPELERVRPSRLAVGERGVDVLSFELNRALLRDDRMASFGGHDFAAEGATPLIVSFIEKGVVPYMPADAHRRVRQVFARAFTTRRVDGNNELVREVIGRIIGDVVSRDAGVCDFVDEVAAYYPIEVICRMVGIPHGEIAEYADALSNLRYVVHIPISEHVVALERSLTTLYDYTSRLLEQRRRQPEDDFLSALITAEEIEGKLHQDELVWGIVNVMLAGTDTTKYQFTSAAHDLAANGVWSRLGDEPDMIPNAVAEITRYRPMPAVLRRLASEDMIIDGTLIPQGTEVKLNLVAAGRDPEKYDEPARFDIDRPMPIFPIIFGGGIHHCIGHALATAELNIGVETITARMTDVEVVSSTEKPWNGVLAGFDQLQLSYRPR
jgi:cytochrome P450